MKIVSRQECEDWLRLKHVHGFTWEALKAHYAHCITYELPSDTGRKTALSRVVIGSIPTWEQGLLWITDWSIFPSSENMALFDGYRKSLGESRAIQVAPGHLFDQVDLIQLECLLDLALYFYWDVSLFDGAGSIAIKTSHDEYFSIFGGDKIRLQGFERSLAPMKLNIREARQ